jgi:hypothetical protein
MRQSCFLSFIVILTCGAALAAEPATTKPLVSEQTTLDFLLDNLPERDVGVILREQSEKTARLARQALMHAPWGEAIVDEIYLNYVAPPTSLTEPRDDWRDAFFRRFSPLVKNCHTSSEAALLLNDGISKSIKLRMPPKEHARPDPSPFETIQAGYASPSGMAILLVDACRSVAVPARVVTAPMLPPLNKDQPSNHFWVEIWDGQWHVISPGENKPLDQGWFMPNLSRAGAASVKVYAASYKKTSIPFPLSWDESDKSVSADDVTFSYFKRVPVRLQVMDREDGMRIFGHLTVRLQGQLIADTDVAEPMAFWFSAGQTYDAVVRAIPGPQKSPRIFTAPAEKGWLLSLPVGD